MENDFDDGNFSDYSKRFKRAFADDFGFSRKFKKQIDEIILRNVVDIKDHEERKNQSDVIADAKGMDRTLKIPDITFGARVRRACAEYLEYAEFTMDTKEWSKSTQPDYYIHGYGDPLTKKLLFYMLWDHKGFIKLAKNGKIKHGMEQNTIHSSVAFLTFSLKKIFDKCAILDFGGSPKTIRQILGNNIRQNRLNKFT